MKNNSSSADDLKAIRNLMEESTRFLSLSGLSGIFPGIIAIAGALFAHFFILNNGQQHSDIARIIDKIIATPVPIWQLITDAIVVLVLSLVSAVFFSYRKMKKAGKNASWGVSKRFIVSLMVPLVAGGLFAGMLLVRNEYQIVVPSLLIFYGLALVNAGKFTYNEIFYLGILEVIVGLFSLIFPGQDLLFWIIGFGVLHILYGIFMYMRYEA